jgi:hypothetical protein
MRRQRVHATVRMPPVQLRSACGNWTREAVVHDHRLAFRVRVSIGGHGVILRENADFRRLFFDNWLHSFEAVEGIECGDGQTVPDNGEEHEPVYDGDHGTGEIVFFFGHCFAGLGEEVAGVLYVEYSANA